MITIMDAFMTLPVWGRAAILLGLFFLILWRMVRKVILRILSVIPFLTGIVFRGIYLFPEWVVSVLHKRCGGYFFHIDNWLSHGAEQIDNRIGKWYKAWHYPGQYSFVRMLFIYLVCVILIGVPSFTKAENKLLLIGEKIYCSGENLCLTVLRRQGDAEKDRHAVKTLGQEIKTKSSFETILVVSGINSSLLVRDQPSLDSGVVLERLHNDDTVVWSGELCFSEADNHHVEPWVKIVTRVGNTGWSRLHYLHPQKYDDREYHVIEEVLLE